jgi:toluene monooxygenase system protein A
MLHQKTIVEHLLTGDIQPPDVGGILAWMGLTPEVMGDDAYKYKWAEEYREPAAAAGAEGGSHV